jgi:hypothetical protein
MRQGYTESLCPEDLRSRYKTPQNGENSQVAYSRLQSRRGGTFSNTGIPQKIITLGQIPPGRAHSLIRQHSTHFPLKDQVEFFEGLTPLIQVGFNPIKAFILQARSTRKLGVRIITMDIVHGILSGELLYMAFSRHRDVLMKLSGFDRGGGKYGSWRNL